MAIHINPNLVSLKCVLFFFFGGLGCLLSFLPIHMKDIGLRFDEIRIISIVAPCVAILGPVIVGPLADKLAGNSGSGGNKQQQTGRYLRVMIAICMILAAVFYLLLLSVPSVARFEARRPSVTFTCDANGGQVLQERCTEERKCHHWEMDKVGSLLLSNCTYACDAPPSTLSLFDGPDSGNSSLTYPDEETDNGVIDDPNLEEDDFASGSGNLFEIDPPRPVFKPRTKRYAESLRNLEPPPHLCYQEGDTSICQVYTEFSEELNVHVSLKQAINTDAGEEEWCRYPVGGNFSCRINPMVAEEIINLFGNKTDDANSTCRPVVQCHVDDPYDAPNSVLAESQCVQTIGDADLTFWMYLVIRSIADIFPTAAIALLDAAVVIATRETSTGRGDVGRQLAWGALGFAIFAPLVGLISQETTPPPFPSYSTAIIVFAIFMFIAAAIILCSTKMPLSPPEWWWHTRSGMLAVPMSAIRRYGYEIAALLGVLVLLGILWSAMDSYLPWHLTELDGSQFLVGFTLTMGALPAVPFLWKAEKVVDYCGHSNLLITAFTIYIIRFTGLSEMNSPNWSMLYEALEVFTLALMWVTAILYLRHLVPRRFTVTGQASAVIAHFCIGRCIGAIVGGLMTTGATKVQSIQRVYQHMATFATIIALVYFILYHFYLKPNCTAATTGPPQPPTIMQGMNGSGTNGTYTPLRVYHNGRAKKGQFRY